MKIYPMVVLEISVKLRVAFLFAFSILGKMVSLFCLSGFFHFDEISEKTCTEDH